MKTNISTNIAAIAEIKTAVSTSKDHIFTNIADIAEINLGIESYFEDIEAWIITTNQTMQPTGCTF